MSQITNAILTFSINEEKIDPNEPTPRYKVMKMIKDWLISYGHNSFTQCKDNYNSKALEAPIFVGAFDYFEYKEFLLLLSRIEWKEPENVQIMIKEQEDTKFRILQFTNLDYKKYLRRIN